MMASVIRGLFWFMAAIMIVATGWDEPLRYRFLSQGQIALEEGALRPPPPRRDMTQWQPNGTALDRGAYRRNQWGIQYTRNSDSRALGTASETGMRSNAFYDPMTGQTSVAPAATPASNRR